MTSSGRSPSSGTRRRRAISSSSATGPSGRRREALAVGARCQRPVPVPRLPAGHERDWYGIFDAFLLTSENEGTPVVAIEALASECPVVATSAGGTATVVRHGESGFLAPDRRHDGAGRPPPRRSPPIRGSRARLGGRASLDVAPAVRLGDDGGRRRRSSTAGCSTRREGHRTSTRSPGISGSERHLLSLLPALRERGVDARFLGLDVPDTDAPRFYAELAAVGRPVRASPLHARREPADGRRGRQSRPRGSRPTCSTPTSCTATSTARSRRASRACPFVSSRHNDDRYLMGPFRHVDRLFARARTPDHRDLGRGARLPRARRPPAGEARDRALRARQPAAGALGGDAVRARTSPRTPRSLLAIGRLIAQKDHATLLRAFARVHAAASGGGARDPRARPARGGDTRGSSASSASTTRVVLPGRVGPATGSSARTCSPTPRAGKGSGSSCSRRCSPGFRSSRRG